MNNCRFCYLATQVDDNDKFGSVFTLQDDFPVTLLHSLVIPARHCVDFFDLTEQELRDTDRALRSLRDRIQAADPVVAGFNIGWNCGKVAGQTIMHAHVHIIPRREGDLPDPRGGVRAVIPWKQIY